MLKYPLPRSRKSKVVYVNDTPHLSVQAARDHKRILGISKQIDYSAFTVKLRAYLQPLLSDRHLPFLMEAYQAAQQGSDALVKLILEEYYTSVASASYMMDKLLADSDAALVEPVFENQVDDIINRTLTWVDSLPDHPLGNYERKLSRKYLSDSSSRTGKGYMAQVKDNYLADRREFKHLPMPNMVIYELAYGKMMQRLGLSNSQVLMTEGSPLYASLIGFLSRARSSTFGGYPYLRNMGDFVRTNESDSIAAGYPSLLEDDVTFADWYNRLAILYLFLHPVHKLRINSDFVALERVQPGGADEVWVENAEYSYTVKPNKQRFVQAQSAVLSHAMKFFVDATTSFLKTVEPTYVADKFGESSVTTGMFDIITSSVVGGKIHPDAVTSVNIVGTDFTNYDATQDAPWLNDTIYMVWRLLFPEWMTYYIIDPYYKLVYSKARILVPKYGYVQTTGVKSGMVETNQADTINCFFLDIYEEEWANNGTVPDSYLRAVERKRMANGDDRFKATLLTAADIEAADGEVGPTAQRYKQEVFLAGQPLSKLGVTYLKTIICLHPDDPHRLLRTDSVGKLILSKLKPEKIVTTSHDYSMVVDFFMGASRSYDSPYLYYYVDFMYAYLPAFRALVDGDIGFGELINHMVRERAAQLALQRGKLWMQRKGMDADFILSDYNAAHGYGDEGFRGNEGALITTSDDAGLAALPAVRAIMSIAHARKAAGTLGSTYM